MICMPYFTKECTFGIMKHWKIGRIKYCVVNQFLYYLNIILINPIFFELLFDFLIGVYMMLQNES